ncbi:PilT/PilU family type 4a pilus ATPase [Candidatus Sumerlaeota bacterium]|nr:PilT/PilU family type 4a pilus ATPase [Candidatus Sumerlaeota bacterium]
MEPGAAPPPTATVPSKLEHLADYLAYARAAGASDLHISAEVKPFLRLHGRIAPLDVPPLRSDQTEALLFEVLSVQQRSVLVSERCLETCIEAPEQGRYRASFVKQRVGWDGTFRVIPDRVPSFEQLGLPDCLRRLTEYQQGLVLVTGSANSGKTTTLAALIDLVNQTRDDHIISIERPIEYVHVSKKCQVTQREAGLHTRSFSTALRAALREDPDIIMVGELSDLETLSMAITASETGHLVFGTLHTTSAARTVSCVLDGFPPAQQAQIRIMLSESLRGVLSQQLVPRKDGRGVALALEIMFVTPAISALIRDNQPFQIPSVLQTSRKMGMCRLDDSLAALLNQGLIGEEEARARAENPTKISGVM